VNIRVRTLLLQLRGKLRSALRAGRGGPFGRLNRKGGCAVTEQKLNIEKERKGAFNDVDDEIFWRVAALAAPYTLLTVEKLYNLYEAVLFVSERGIPGALVECGVFKGGAVVLMAETLSAHGFAARPIYLFDTFFGFTGRSEHDVDYGGREIGKYRTQNFRQEVAQNLSASAYPRENYTFVEGDVIATSHTHCPEQIAILRLDTDTYDTTRAELENMYPKLIRGGVLIVDDYGYSKGCRKAVDEYFAQAAERPFLQRPNKGSRTAIKC
jgi:hypothetical protein